MLAQSKPPRRHRTPPPPTVFALHALPDTRIADLLARHVADGASASAVADVVVTIWSKVDLALTPIVAARGCALLYQRSLHRSSASFPWLADAYGGAHSAPDLPALHRALAQQDPTTVAAAGTELLGGFRDQLAGLIGAALTECLLRSAWTQPPYETPAQDTDQ